MLDKIFLRDYRKDIEIGVFDEEHQTLQTVSFTVILELNSQMPNDDEDVDGILSYDVIIEAIETCLGRKRYKLLEVLAEDIAQVLLRYEVVNNAEIKIEKLDRVDGALGLQIIRNKNHLRQHIDISSKMDVLYILFCDTELPVIEVPERTILMPMLTNKVSTHYEKRIFAAELDHLAWRLGKLYSLPVVESLTEAYALAHQSKNFVLAPSRLLNAIRPSLEQYSQQELTDWAKENMPAEKLQIHIKKP